MEDNDADFEDEDADKEDEGGGLVYCGCKKGCSTKQCGCKKAGNFCSESCSCRNECSACSFCGTE